MLFSAQAKLTKLNPLAGQTYARLLHLAVLTLSGFIFCGTVSYAGYGSFSSIDYYDETTGYYYKSVQAKAQKGGFLSSKSPRNHISNLFLYDPATQKSRLLFPAQAKDRHISFVVHERKYISKIAINKEKFFEFYNYGRLSIQNNQDLKQRPLRDHMLVGVYLPKSKQTELWLSKKDGTDLKKLITPPQGSSWHIDLKANKIRVFSPDAQKGFIVTNFDW